jgi:hypothetical protein
MARYLTVCVAVYVASDRLFLSVSVAMSAANGLDILTVYVVVYVASDWIFL